MEFQSSNDGVWEMSWLLVYDDGNRDGHLNITCEVEMLYEGRDGLSYHQGYITEDGMRTGTCSLIRHLL